MAQAIYDSAQLRAAIPHFFAPAKPYSPGFSYVQINHTKPDMRTDRTLFICRKSYREGRGARRLQAKRKYYYRTCYYTVRKPYLVAAIGWTSGDIVALAEFPTRSAAAKHITTLL